MLVVAGLGLGGCSPSVDPVWVLARARELGLRIELGNQGAYGERVDPQGPSAAEFLPLDEVVATPLVADAQGAISPDDLEVRWFLCDDDAACLLTADLEAARSCADEPLSGPVQPCALGDDPVVRVTLGEPPLAPVLEEPDGGLSAIDVATARPVLGLLASPPDGPGVDECARRIAERSSLTGCLLIERSIPLGPLSEVIDVLEPLGYDIDLSDSLGPLLQRPRNHNPAPPTFRVTTDASVETVASGAIVRVPVGSDVVLQWVPAVDDIESFEVTLSGEPEPGVVEETVVGLWFVSREVDEYEPSPSGWELRWRATQPEPATFHLLLRDDRGSETTGWIAVDVTG
jgi:hypothetical protein